ncbi:thiamine diphosphokinase [Paracoccus bogoriensis]|uniref:thiamine diphosphokinase n=1 Tax=Paracoccus bogoriensis TaxID=242065 RepID=UPI001CA4C6CA|nr:thiamine diphosphokinase [Paracoccus bogoriensis]MBW7055883.1 thiamine diphosphokinase [Paracoccus bogoriensis]
MMPPLLVVPGGVTLVGGGAVAADELRAALARAPHLVAADGGADRALALSAMPDLVIGDLDSLGSEARARIAADRIHHIPEQDSTDFTKCLRRIDAGFVLAVGFLGGRLDHALAALTSLAAEARMPVILIGAEDVIFLAPPVLDLALEAGTRVSLWPLGPVRGRSLGLEWPIDGLDFAPTGRVGTSNRALGPVSLRLDGPMLVMLPPDCLDAALDALGLRSA